MRARKTGETVCTGYTEPWLVTFAVLLKSIDIFFYSDIEPVYQSSAVERIKLPTAPKASRGSDVDMSRIPVDPPYLAFIGNLPYEVSPEKIETFFGNLPVSIPDRL